MGRYVFGVTSMLLGIACIALHDQLISNWQLLGDAVFLFVTSAALIAGGVGVLFPAVARPAALLLGCVYFLATLTFLPDVVQQPGVYASWGDVCYPLAPALGAVVAYCLASPSTRAGTAICKAGVMLMGICSGSYAVEQVEFLSRTASLVPKWMPPNGNFWAIATTIAFGLAAVSLASGYKALLASRLLTVMFLIFTFGVWLPILIADPRTHSNWSEGLETLAIAGAVWIVADFLATRGVKEANA
jgi:uncharacterized membrane protein YphA (DoxX/SURF4 family)